MAKSAMEKAMDKIGKAIGDVVTEAISTATSTNGTEEGNENTVPQEQSSNSKEKKFTVKTLKAFILSKACPEAKKERRKSAKPFALNAVSDEGRQ